MLNLHALDGRHDLEHLVGGVARLQGEDFGAGHGEGFDPGVEAADLGLAAEFVDALEELEIRWIDGGEVRRETGADGELFEGGSAEDGSDCSALLDGRQGSGFEVLSIQTCTSVNGRSDGVDSD